MHAVAAAALASLVLATAAAAAPAVAPEYELPPPAPPEEQPAPPPPPAPTGARSLVATVGPGFTITLRTATGKRVRKLKAGRYTVTVRDRADFHNFRLRGPGVNRATGVSFVGTARWKVRFRKGKTYRFGCDPHITSMKGSFRVR